MHLKTTNLSLVKVKLSSTIELIDAENLVVVAFGNEVFDVIL